jgi:hypothetical protein
MSQLDTKIKKFKGKPKYLYVGTNQKVALMEKFPMIDKNFQLGIGDRKYEGLEVILVCKQSFLEVG